MSERQQRALEAAAKLGPTKPETAAAIEAHRAFYQAKRAEKNAQQRKTS